MVGGSIWDVYKDDVWWYGKSKIGNKLSYKSPSGFFGQASETWTSANKFSKFLTASGRAIQFGSAAMLDLGDVIQLQIINGDIHHTMLVTGFDPKTQEILLSYHTNNQLDNPLSKVVAASGGQTLIYWKLLDVIP